MSRSWCLPLRHRWGFRDPDSGCSWCWRCGKITRRWFRR